MQNLKQGDYVLATKWSDGHSFDHWYVGYFHEYKNDRYFINDSNGVNVSVNGFRRCEIVHPIVGQYLVENSNTISNIKLNLWEYIKSSIHNIAIENYEDELFEK